MSVSKSKKRAAVRIETSLNQKEQEFVSRRRNTVLQNLEKLQIQCSQDDVPNIALLGSGGGQRAMVSLLGSMVQLKEADLLDCVLYLSGISGSTWCMASLYQEPDWSSKLETVKDKIIQRLSGPGVSQKDTLAKLKKYYYGKKNFSLTDVWAVMVVATFVKEIDEHTLSDYWNEFNKDPYPIYAVIDKQCKQEEEDPWVEITPHEAGYSLTGAFVDACSFGSGFHEGSMKHQQDEFDMLYLQALCGSALANKQEFKKVLWEKIKNFFQTTFKKNKVPKFQKDCAGGDEDEEDEDEDMDENEKYEECYTQFMKLLDTNIDMLDEEEHVSGEEDSNTEFQADASWTPKNPRAILNSICDSGKSRVWPYNLWVSICKQMLNWIWGRNYNFLHNMKDQSVPPALLETETRDFIDGGLLNNSPYVSVLRKERNMDLIISLDFSQTDPFKTVKNMAERCKEINIPFPEVHVPDEDVKKPKDFYVFKGQNAPTVIHIPLFNEVNCGDQLENWRKKYRTFQGPYSAEMITDLVEAAGKNILNNKEKLKEEIRTVIGQKESRRKQ